MDPEPDPDPYLLLVDPDPGGPKTCGSGGSGSGCGSGSATIHSVGLLATHAASMGAPSGAVLFDCSQFYLSCSWFLASYIRRPCCLSTVFVHSVFCVASVRS